MFRIVGPATNRIGGEQSDLKTARYVSNKEDVNTLVVVGRGGH